ncbi:hypothetical protein [Mesorhizobium sp. M0011]|uniref:hypothetical protein n=1 Tax=Mesorhizobium sp. M0011 TaxID=2956839 RepID=UPI00333B9233
MASASTSDAIRCVSLVGARACLVQRIGAQVADHLDSAADGWTDQTVEAAGLRSVGPVRQ